MKSAIAFTGVLLFQFVCFATKAGEAVEVTLNPVDNHGWHISFETANPTTQIKLLRTPDDSRLHRWKLLDDGFSLDHDGRDDWIRKSDGSSFSQIAVAVPGTYITLPKEYAPFSPFQDGGLLVYSGRYHACAGECADESADTDGPWKMTLALPTKSRAIVNGAIHEGPVTWRDVDDGTKIYFGPAEPFESDNFISVVDEGLPKHIRELLRTLLPELMDFYASRLPPPVRKPMLFASYDPGYGKGFGQQGGTLPDQVFMHFYGPGWTDGQNSDPSDDVRASTGMIAFFFAHEAAHLFQARDRIRPRDEIAWLHEGGAEAFAWLALTDMRAISADYAEYRKFEASDKCASGLAVRPLNEATAAGHYQDHYACGLLMNLAIDSAVRKASDGQRDLFDFWRSFLASIQEQSDWSQENIFRALRQEGAENTARFLESLVYDHQHNAEGFLHQGLAEAGLTVN